MFATVITDCYDDNARGRVETRMASLTGASVSSVRVSGDLTQEGEIQAAGNLIDVLDAGEGKRGVVLVNIAPRNGQASKEWDNGTPFGYFYHNETLVLTTIDGLTLSMVKKLGLVEEVEVIQMRETLEAHFDPRDIPQPIDHIVHSQFRSFDFLPRIAAHLLNGNDVVAITKDLKEVEDIGNRVWWIDNFGNVKTTMLPGDIAHRAGETIDTVWGPLGYHSSLRDVPDRDTAIIAGSSGLGDRRLLEIVQQGGSAAHYINASVGDVVVST